KDLIRLFSVKKMSRPDMVEADLEKIIWEISKYDPDIIIADNGDSGNNVLKLINHFGEDKVFGCTYKSSPKSTGQLRPEFNENKNTVTVDKLMQNKLYIQGLKTKNIRMYQEVDDDLRTFLKHWQNVLIMDEEDEKTEEMRQVIKRKGDDHWAQASVYSNIGLIRIQSLLKEGNGTSFGSTFVSTDYNQEGNNNSTLMNRGEIDLTNKLFYDTISNEEINKSVLNLLLGEELSLDYVSKNSDALDVKYEHVYKSLGFDNFFDCFLYANREHEIVHIGGDKNLGRLNKVKRTVIRNGKEMQMTVYEDGNKDNDSNEKQEGKEEVSRSAVGARAISNGEEGKVNPKKVANSLSSLSKKGVDVSHVNTNSSLYK